MELLEPADVRRRWPFIDQLDGIAGATFSPRDGLVTRTPSASTTAPGREPPARSSSTGLLVTGVRRDDDRVTGVEVRELDGPGEAAAALENGPANGSAPGPGRTLACGRMVNAAGPWASVVAELTGAPVPCRAVPRQLCVLASRDVDLSEAGMIVNTSDVYFHHEAGELFLAGYSPPDDPPGYRFEYEGRAFFEREVWPRLAARISAFDRLEHVRGWAGLYELSPDHSALVGPVEGHGTSTRSTPSRAGGSCSPTRPP